VTYIAETGTGTLATCRVPATGAFSFATDPTNGGADMTKACPYQETYMSGTRNAKPDYLLFRRGDCFVDPGQISPCLGTVNSYTTSWGVCIAHGSGCNYSRVGQDASNYTIVGAFGPLATARPKFITLNTCVGTQAISGNFVAVIDLYCDVAAASDYKNPVYNPGMFTAAVATAGVKTISAVVSCGVTCTRVTVPSTTNLSNHPVVIAGVVGTTEANGTWPTITNVTATTFEIPVAFVNTYVSGGTAGSNRITLTAAPSAQIIFPGTYNSWNIVDFGNITSLKSASSSAGMRLNGLSGVNVTLLNVVPVGYDVAVDDRLVFIPFFTNGISLNSNSLINVYVEGNYVTGGSYGWNNTLPHSSEWPNAPQLSAIFRRNVGHQSSTIQGRYQGFFFGDSFNPSSTMLIEENLADHAGWRQNDSDCVPGKFLPAKCGGVGSEQYENFYGNPNDQSQNMYDHENCCIATINRNIMTNGSGTGVQVRSGGALYNNFIFGNASGGTGGGIVTANNATYNVLGNLNNSYCAILQVTGVAGNVLTFDYVPQVLSTSTGCVGYPFNASNPSGINQSTNQTYTITKTTVTIGGPAITASIGDWIYFATSGPKGGYQGDSASVVATGTVNPNLAFPTNAQWNIVTNALSSSSIGGNSATGFGITSQGRSLRSVGNVFKNNYVMNVPLGIYNQSDLLGVDGTGCGGAVRVTISQTAPFIAGDSIIVSGTAPSSMNANGTFTVTSPTTTTMCLGGSTFGTGTWTTDTGVINGGVDWGFGTSANNKYYNVTTPTNRPTTSMPTAFTPVGTAGCPQAANCPSIESYDLSIGGDGTLSHFLIGARANRKGAWDYNYTAAKANNYIRQWTDAAIAQQPQ
jgi:hypothetical protein